MSIPFLEVTRPLDYWGPQPFDELGRPVCSVMGPGLVAESYLRSEMGDAVVDAYLDAGIIRRPLLPSPFSHRH